MKVLGIVVEYNPFHNGHIYHIEQSKAVTGSDAVVCVMSGNFIQRGEPAIINKFARAEIALKNGADLVLELPHPFALSSAETFGFGAVKILDGIGIVDCISFGSEQGDIEVLKEIAHILVMEPGIYKEELKKQLASGLSYPVCRQNALKKYLEHRYAGQSENGRPYDGTQISGVLETSNNILGIEYLKALIKLNSPIKPYTVKRIANQYNSAIMTGPISSATAIRNSIFSLPETENLFISQEALKTIPPHAKTVIENEFLNGRGPVNLKAFENVIFALLRQMSPEQINRLPDVSEGLEYRIKACSETSGTLEELIGEITTKRYPQTRIQRILSSLLSGVTKSDMALFMEHGGPQYARVLGFNSIGQELLSKMKKNSSLPFATKFSGLKNSCNAVLARMVEIEAKATDIYVLGYKNPAFKKAGQDFTQNIIRFP